MYNYKILVIDDNIALSEALKIVLGKYFKSVGAISEPKLIPAILNGGKIDLVLLDMNFDTKKLNGDEGLFWLSNIKERKNPPAVILITAFGDINLAVESMKRGAEDFITKPWNNEDLIEKILTAIEKNSAKANCSLDSLETDETKIDDEINSSPTTLEEMEKERISHMLKLTKRNMTLAAMQLGITRRTLYNKIERYGL